MKAPTHVIQYLETALWSSTDEHGKPLDRENSVNDFTVDSFGKATRELTEFMEKVQFIVSVQCTTDADQFAHDFWLSRNGHGTGFFDKPEFYGKCCKELQALAKSFGECHISVQENGRLDLY